MKFFLEVVQDQGGKYYANMTMGGGAVKPFAVKRLPRSVDYRTLAEGIKKRTGVEIPKRKHLSFERFGGKRYAYVDATQPLEKGSVVTLWQVLAGHRPDFA